jgi:DNA-binding MarR family transcriptional regulator
MANKNDTITKERLEAISEFRYRLRCFLRFSEDASREAGITVLQYQLLLHTQGFAGRDWATVSELAERLQAQPHGVVALVSRCEEAGLVRRMASDVDRRQVEVHLLPKGRKFLESLAIQHQDQLAEFTTSVKAAGEVLRQGGSTGRR